MGGREGRRGVPRPPRAPGTQDLACSQEGAGGQLWSPGGCDRHRDGTGPTSPPLCWVPGLAKVHDPLSHSKAHLKDSSCSLRGSKCLRLTPHTRVLTDDDKAHLAPPPARPGRPRANLVGGQVQWPGALPARVGRTHSRKTKQLCTHSHKRVGLLIHAPAHAHTHVCSEGSRLPWGSAPMRQDLQEI